ncbi:proteoglycan 4 isoform X3 [Cataglyphis hispanica]|uniref:proteoglycan 4 isoform X3 n=1 Tax=Cataglyphis hispanica TaxID=1086592 RepID=UPI00217FF7A6|nr:proteoglycan 4 isoform X3 [Cataglyphis hispanica]
MPANKSNLSTPRKEKPGNGLMAATAAATSKKKKRPACIKHKKHCKQYLQLHSEYRSTYTWHEYTGPHQEHAVVRRAPQPPLSRPTLEPPLPRRKKCPELAYKTHEFITAADGGGIDAIDSNVVADKEVTSTLPPSQLSKAISRISTEYRLQFAWPKKPQLINGETQAPVLAAGFSAGTTGPPRKSLSMGALKQGMTTTGPAPVHKKRPGDFDHKRDGIQASELEPLVGSGTDAIDGMVPEGDEREEDMTDLKITFRKNKSKKIVRISEAPGKLQAKPFPMAEVIELRRLADEYKHRDWGCGLTAEDEASLWKQVSNNHALNALSLARSVTKEEKEKENRKVAPIVSMIATRPPAGRPSSVQARPIHGLLDDTKADNDRAIARARKDFLIRHHLDRTTGVGDGALLPSPTREKLEPVIPRRRDDIKEHRDEIQPRTKSSPKNSPRTGRSQSLGPTVTDRRSPKRQPTRAPSVTKDAKEKEKETKDKEQREKSSEPERHPRPTFLATTALPHRPLHHVKPTTTITTNTTTTVTTANSTSAPVKRSPVKHSVHTTVHHPPTSGAAAAAARPERGVKDLSQRCQGANDEVQAKLARGHPAAAAAAAGNDPSSKSSLDTRSASNQAATAVVQAMTAEPQINGDGGDSSIASTPPSQKHATVPMSAMQASQWLDDEPVVKSPPEPTRVKSPEQMIMRSPEPVNWTVPLDTGKTFTVTQNVREEPLTRPHSETKTWAPSSVPSAPQSAPPELAAQHKSQHSQHSGYKSPESESVSLGSFSGINGHKDLDSERDSPLPTNIQDTSTKTEKITGIVEETKERQSPEPSVKSVAGTNLRYLEDPTSEMEKKKDNSPPTTIATTLATTSSSPATQQSYRILEAESSPQDTGGSGGTTSTGSSTMGGYHVLEAPAIVPDSTQRSAASDVLEKARNRFDKFWGKGNGTEN